MRPPNNINTSRPIQISVDGRDSYIQVDTGGYNLTNDGIECNDPDTSIFIPWKYIQWIEQSTAVDTVFNRQTTHNNTGANTGTNPASIVDSRDDEIRLLERNNPFARIDMKLFKQCVNNHIIEHDENGWRIRISNQRIGYNEDQAMSVIRSNPSLQVYLAQSLSTIPLSDTDENHANTNASMSTVDTNTSMNQFNSDNDNKKQSDYTNDPWVTIDDDTANDDGMQALLTVDPQADNEYMLDDYDDNMSYTPEMLIESYNDDTHSNTTTSTANSDNTTANSDSKTASTMNNKSANNVSTVNNISTSSDDAGADDSTTASMSNKPTTTKHRKQSYASTETGFSFGFGFTTNNKNTTTSANNVNNASMSSHDSHEISDANYKNNNLNRIITVNNDVHMTAAHMPNAITNASTASTVNTDTGTSKLVNSMNSESSSSNGMPVSDTASMQPSSSMMNNTDSNANNSDYIDNNATSPIHPSRKKKNPVKHHLTDYEVDDSSNTDNATTADENGCDWVVLMVALGYAGTIVSRWRSRAEAEADRDARIENNNVNSSMIPLNYMVFRANGNRLYDRKYIPRDKNGIPLKGYNEYGEYVAGLPGYEF